MKDLMNKKYKLAKISWKSTMSFKAMIPIQAVSFHSIQFITQN